MEQVFITLAQLMIGATVLFALVVYREFVEPCLIGWGSGPDAVWTRRTLKLIATVLIGAPIGPGFWASRHLGLISRPAKEYHLLFRTGRNEHISFFYQGADELIALAEDRLQAYARTS